MVIHVGSDETAVQAELPSGWMEIDSYPPSVSNSIESYSTSTPRARCETPNTLPAIFTVPLRG